MTKPDYRDPYRPPAPTHTGPAGPVRARQWSGVDPDNIRGFLDGPGGVSFWFLWFDGHHYPNMRLFLDLEDGTVQAAHPGDWVTWRGDQCRVVAAATFDALYRRYCPAETGGGHDLVGPSCEHDQHHACAPHQLDGSLGAPARCASCGASCVCHCHPTR